MRLHASTIALVYAGMILGGAASPDAPQPRPAARGWMDRHQQKLQEIRQGPVDVIFLGDSITEEMENSKPSWGNIPAVWQKFYGCRHAVNLGFNGDSTSNVLWRIENGEVDGVRPKLAVLMIGTNNIRPKITSDAGSTASAIVAVVDELHRRLPATKILVLGIPPSGREASVEDERAQVNQTLARHDWRASAASFVNVDAALTRDGRIDTTLYRGAVGRPPVHPNAQGWQNIAALIEPDVARLSGLGSCR